MREARSPAMMTEMKSFLSLKELFFVVSIEIRHTRFGNPKLFANNGQCFRLTALFARRLYYIESLNRIDSSRKNYQSNLIVEWVLETLFFRRDQRLFFLVPISTRLAVFFFSLLFNPFSNFFLSLPPLLWLIAWVKFFSLSLSLALPDSFTSPSPRKKNRFSWNVIN